MEITVTRGGGFVPDVHQLGPIQTDELDGDLGSRIEARLEEVGFFELPEQVPDHRSQLWSKVAVEDGDRQHSVTFDSRSDAEPNKSLRDLVSLIEESGVEFHPVATEGEAS